MSSSFCCDSEVLWVTRLSIDFFLIIRFARSTVSDEWLEKLSLEWIDIHSWQLPPSWVSTPLLFLLDIVLLSIRSFFFISLFSLPWILSTLDRSTLYSWLDSRVCLSSSLLPSSKTVVSSLKLAFVRKSLYCLSLSLPLENWLVLSCFNSLVRLTAWWLYTPQVEGAFSDLSCCLSEVGSSLWKTLLLS